MTVFDLALLKASLMYPGLNSLTI